MWFRTAKEKHHIVVETENGTFVGSLAFEGTLRRGGGLVIRAPMVLTADRRLTVTGADFLLLDESQIRNVQVTLPQSSPSLSTQEKDR